jgi:hypothetical protein
MHTPNSVLRCSMRPEKMERVTTFFAERSARLQPMAQQSFSAFGLGCHWDTIPVGEPLGWTPQAPIRKAP